MAVLVELFLAVLPLLVLYVKEFYVVLVSPAWRHHLWGKVNGRLGDERPLGSLAGGLVLFTTERNPAPIAR